MAEGVPTSQLIRSPTENCQAWRVVLPYLVLGAAWVFLSDGLISQSNLSPALRERWGLINGLGFITVTSGILWLQLTRMFKRWGTTITSLAESEASYQDLYERAPDMYLSIEATTGRVLKCNQALVEATGYTKAEIVGQPVSRLYHADCPAASRHAVPALFTSGEVREAELQLQRKDGERIDVSVTGVAVRDGAGRICASHSVWRDVTQRKQTELALLESNARWHYALEGAGDGVWDWDVQTNRVFYSQQLKAMLGFAEAEIGDSLQEWEKRVHPDDRARVQSDLDRYFAGETPAYANERRLRCRDGSYRWILDRGKVVTRGPDGRPLRMIGTHADISRLKAAETAIQARLELEARLSKIANHIPGVIYTFRLRPDGTMHLPFASPAVADLFAVSPAELQDDAAPVFRLVHPDDLKPLERSIAESAQKLTPWHEDYRLRHPQKGEIWIEARSTPEREADGSVLWHGFVHDISARKRNEEQLRKLSRAVEHSSAAVVITDFSGTIEYVNPKFTQITGYSAAEVLGKNPSLLKSGETPRATYREMWETIKGGGDWRGEFHNKKKNGDLFWEADSISPVRDEHNQITHFVAVKEDITIQKQAEQQIREQAALLDQTQDAVLVMGLDHRITYCNQSAVRLYGQLLREIGDTPLFPSHPERCAEVCQHTIVRGSWAGEIQDHRVWGKIRTVQSRWTLVRSLAGEQASFLITNTDVTERQRLELQLLRAQRLESLGNLAGGVAHDLNNILAPILMSLEFLRPLARQAQDLEMVAMLEEGVRRGADIVKQLLIFGRGVEGQRAELQPRNLLLEMARIIRETFPKSITLQPLFPTELWTIDADPTQIHQILLNLCVNARDAMPEGGMLTLTAENLVLDEEYAAQNPEAHAGNYIVIAVTDTGSGIPTEILDRIFEPFFTTKTPDKGTGLGLSTVLGIAKSHGGFVRVQSGPGTGSQFKVYLPALDSSTVPPAASLDANQLAGKGQLILLVDDEDAVRAMGRRMLEARGYRVATASNGAEGIVQYSHQAQEIRLVVTDMVMPIMDGAAMIRVLRRLAPRLPIVATSGLPEAPTGEPETAPPTDAFLAKPFRADALDEVLRQLLEVRPQPDFPAHD